MSKKILIYGYGNPGRSDDGLGNALIEKLEEYLEQNKIENIGYDFEKDDYINSILNQKPIFIKTELNTTIIRYEQLQFTIYYNEYIPYKQIQSYDIVCKDKNGKTIILESEIIPEHNISKKTLNRIKMIGNSEH